MKKLFTILLLSVCFVSVPSCQKDSNGKGDDPNRLSAKEAKEFFEQHSTCLRFLSVGGDKPSGTKSALTENMIIDWDSAIESETSDAYFVEVPINMASPITAFLYDGIGHINKNIRPVPLNISLVIEMNKNNESFNSFVVTTLGSYSNSLEDSRYGFRNNKNTFTGYQLFSKENGLLFDILRFNNGGSQHRNLLTQSQVCKVDSLGRDLLFKGISFITSSSILTKGGGGGATGEDRNCLSCGGPMVITETGIDYVVFYCPVCKISTIVFIDVIPCPVCGYPSSSCHCCPTCHSYPCVCFLNPDPENSQPCSLCGRPVCDGSCQNVLPGEMNIPENFHRVTVLTDPYTPYGYITKYPTGDYIAYGVEVTISATATQGYSFIGWRRDSTIFSNSNPYVFYPQFNQTIYAVFASN